MNRQSAIRRKLNLPHYLQELEALTGVRVTEEKISSLAELQEVLSKLKEEHRGSQLRSFTVRSEDRLSDRFKRYVDDLYNLNRSAVFIWITRTNDCGLFKVANVRNVKFDFDFNSGRAELVELVTTDLKDKLMIDAFTDEDGVEVLTITATGNHWPSAVY